MQKNTRIIKNHHLESYLIGNSPSEGNDQVISRTIKYNEKGLYDEQNEKRISEAKDITKRCGFFNIRLVTVTFDAIYLPGVGIIEYRPSKQKIEKYKLFMEQST